MTDLLPEFRQGFVSPVDATNPYYATSMSSEAWYLGKWFSETGKAYPFRVETSRGMSLKILTSPKAPKWDRWIRSRAITGPNVGKWLEAQ